MAEGTVPIWDAAWNGLTQSTYEALVEKAEAFDWLEGHLASLEHADWLLGLICFVAAVLLMFAYSLWTGLLYVP